MKAPTEEGALRWLEVDSQVEDDIASEEQEIESEEDEPQQQQQQQPTQPTATTPLNISDDVEGDTEG